MKETVTGQSSLLIRGRARSLFLEGLAPHLWKDSWGHLWKNSLLTCGKTRSPFVEELTPRFVEELATHSWKNSRPTCGRTRSPFVEELAPRFVEELATHLGKDPLLPCGKREQPDKSKSDTMEGGEEVYPTPTRARNREGAFVGQWCAIMSDEDEEGKTPSCAVACLDLGFQRPTNRTGSPQEKSYTHTYKMGVGVGGAGGPHHVRWGRVGKDLELYSCLFSSWLSTSHKPNRIAVTHTHTNCVWWAGGGGGGRHMSDEDEKGKTPSCTVTILHSSCVSTPRKPHTIASGSKLYKGGNILLDDDE